MDPEELDIDIPNNDLPEKQQQELPESNVLQVPDIHHPAKTDPPQQQSTEKVQETEEWFGINKKLYIYNTNKNQIPTVKTGIQDVLLPNNPDFLQFKEDQYQMYEPKPFILEEAIKRDIQIICFMTSLMKKIVYDLYDNPPQTKDLNPKTYGLDVMPYYLPTSQSDTTLVFESRFQTGNLRRAIQLMEYEYQLILKTDWQTTGHTQWFYFSVANTRKNVEYKFTIINLMKPDSLYNSGMKPLFYSEKKAKYESKLLQILKKLDGFGTDMIFATTRTI